MKILLPTIFLMVFAAVCIQGSSSGSSSDWEKSKIKPRPPSKGQPVKRISARAKIEEAARQRKKDEEFDKSLNRKILKAAETLAKKASVDLTKEEQLKQFWEFANRRKLQTSKDPKEVANWALQKVAIENKKTILASQSKPRKQPRKPRKVTETTEKTKVSQGSDGEVMSSSLKESPGSDGIATGSTKKPFVEGNKESPRKGKETPSDTELDTEVMSDLTDSFGKLSRNDDGSRQEMEAALQIWGGQSPRESRRIQKSEMSIPAKSTTSNFPASNSKLNTPVTPSVRRPSPSIPPLPIPLFPSANSSLWDIFAPLLSLPPIDTHFLRHRVLRVHLDLNQKIKWETRILGLNTVLDPPALAVHPHPLPPSILNIQVQMAPLLLPKPLPNFYPLPLQLKKKF